MLALDEFMVRHFYHDQPQIEIHRVLKAFTVFPTYNRQLAELGPAGEAISAELFAEFVAYLLDIKEEPRLRKVCSRPRAWDWKAFVLRLQNLKMCMLHRPES